MTHSLRNLSIGTAILVMAGCTGEGFLRPAIRSGSVGAVVPPPPLDPNAVREAPFARSGISSSQAVRPGLTRTDWAFDPLTASYAKPPGATALMGATQPSFSHDGQLMFSERSFNVAGGGWAVGIGVSIVDYAATTEAQGMLGFALKTGDALNPRTFPLHRYRWIGKGGSCNGEQVEVRRDWLCPNTTWDVGLHPTTESTYNWHVTTFLPNTRSVNPFLSDEGGAPALAGGTEFQTYQIGLVGSVVSKTVAGDLDASPQHPYYTPPGIERNRAWSCIAEVTVRTTLDSGFRVPAQIMRAQILPTTCNTLELTTSSPNDRRVPRGIEFTMTYAGDLLIFHGYDYPPATYKASDNAPTIGHMLVSRRLQGSVTNPKCLEPEESCVPLRYSRPAPFAELYEFKNQLIPARNTKIPGVTYGQAYPLTRFFLSTPKGDRQVLMSNGETARNIEFAYPWSDPDLKLLTGISRFGKGDFLERTPQSLLVQLLGGLWYCLFSDVCHQPQPSFAPIPREGFDVLDASHVARLPAGGFTYPIIATDSPLSEHRTLLARVTSGSIAMSGAWSPMHRLPIAHFKKFKIFPGENNLTSYVSNNNFYPNGTGPLERQEQTLMSQMDSGGINRAGFLFYSSLAPSGDFVFAATNMPGIKTDFLSAIDLSPNRVSLGLNYTTSGHGAFYTYNDPVTSFAGPWGDHGRGFQIGAVGDGVSMTANGAISASETGGITNPGTLLGYGNTLSVVGWFKLLGTGDTLLADGPAYTIRSLADRRIQVTARATGGTSFTATSTETVTQGQYFHLVTALTARPETGEIEIRLYTNGVYSLFQRSAQFSGITGLHKDSRPIFFGPRGNQSGGQIVLQVDEIGVAPRRLDAREIRTLAMIPDPEPRKDLVTQRSLLGPLAPVLENTLQLDILRAYVPTDNPITQPKRDLGQALFFDTHLSSTGSISCASCHQPSLGFSSPHPGGKSPGVTGVPTSRTSPSLINMVFANPEHGYFLDGRAATLEEQVVGPLLNPLEMGMPSMATVVAAVKAQTNYGPLVQAAFSKPLTDLTEDDIKKALATFMRGLVAGNSPYDRHLRGEAGALTASQLRGLGIFNNKCLGCHNGPLLSDRKPRNIGITLLADPDLGRMAVTTNPLDRGSFISPGLRDLQFRLDKHGHDGRTLDEFLTNYSVGGLRRQESTSADVHAADLTQEDRLALFELLISGFASGYRSF